MRRFFRKEEADMAMRDFGALAQQWRDLEAAGIPLEPLENRAGIARSPGRILTIRSGSHRLGTGEIRELRDGRFGFGVSVFIRRDSPGKTIIRDGWISPPWTDPSFEWLEDPKDSGQHPAWYSFPRDSEHFARVEVLNHRIRCVLSRGTSGRVCFWESGVGGPLTRISTTPRFQSPSLWWINGISRIPRSWKRG
jgi:hypothetical protein